MRGGDGHGRDVAVGRWRDGAVRWEGTRSGGGRWSDGRRSAASRAEVGVDAVAPYTAPPLAAGSRFGATNLRRPIDRDENCCCYFYLYRKTKTNVEITAPGVEIAPPGQQQQKTVGVAKF